MGSTSNVLTVSDVFHTASPDTALWEFKHGGGNFKRGDLVGLREIKRRASKHSLVHREYNSQKPSPLQPGTPAESMPISHDSSDARLEHALYDVGIRLQRSEESAHYMHARQHALSEMLSKSMFFNQELTRLLLTLVPTPEHPVYRDGKLATVSRLCVPVTDELHHSRGPAKRNTQAK